MRKLFYFSLSLVFVLLSCSEGQGMGESPSGSGVQSFRIQGKGYACPGEGNTPRTRASSETVRFDTLSHYLFREDGTPVSNVRSLFDPATSSIKAEGLTDGDYILLVLAWKGDASADGAALHKLTGLTSSWITFTPTGAGESLKAEYYYVNHPFTVFNGTIDGADVVLDKLVSRVSFNFDYDNRYVANSIESIDITPDASSAFCTELRADGQVTAANTVAPFAYNGQSCLFFPPKEGTVFTGTVTLKSVRHTGDKLQRSYKFSAVLRPGENSVIRVEVQHPDDNIGTVWIKSTDYVSTNSYRILADDEPKSVYYDANQRSFRLNQPLQYNLDAEGRFHMRFYSPVPMHDVGLYVKLSGVEDYIELCHFSEIPAFIDATIDLLFGDRERWYRTPEGKQILIPALGKLTSLNPELKIVTEDVYWQKISRIKCPMLITWDGMGGNPDAVDGAPVSPGWSGIRPVHIRESVAVYTNIAYLCSMQEFADWLQTFQGRLYNNRNTSDVIDVSTIIPKINALQSVVIGLVDRKFGFIGLTETLYNRVAVYQSSYLYHYSDNLGNSTIFHELAHYIGYNHASNMTEGIQGKDYELFGKGICAPFYIRNLSKLPVNSSSYLNSSQNPNKYPG